MYSFSRPCVTALLLLTCCYVNAQAPGDASPFKLREVIGECKEAGASECVSVCMDAFVAVRKAVTNVNDAVEKCYAEHSKLQSEDTTQPSADSVVPPSQTSMPDIEGTYLQANRNGFRVRVEGREDWKIYCNEAARIGNGQKEFSRTVKAYERVRLVGISYDPSQANKTVTHCMAESATILGPSQ